jgi:hypothetical protein
MCSTAGSLVSCRGEGRLLQICVATGVDVEPCRQLLNGLASLCNLDGGGVGSSTTQDRLYSSRHPTSRSRSTRGRQWQEIHVCRRSRTRRDGQHNARGRTKSINSRSTSACGAEALKACGQVIMTRDTDKRYPTAVRLPQRARRTTCLAHSNALGAFCAGPVRYTANSCSANATCGEPDRQRWEMDAYDIGTKPQANFRAGATACRGAERARIPHDEKERRCWRRRTGQAGEMDAAIRASRSRTGNRAGADNPPTVRQCCLYGMV